MIASNGPTCKEFRRSALLQSAIDIWYRAGPRSVVLHDIGIGEPAITDAFTDIERGNLTRMLKKGKGCKRADDEKTAAVTNEEYPFQSGFFVSPTLEGIPSDKEAFEGDSAAKRHKSTSRSRSILPQSLFSIADMDAAELVALELNKPKVLARCWCATINSCRG